ncbi:MAG TPA: [FeFe] hydrogenase, group A [Atribacteraceae bacterium]|nr:[FeFe] hydrogenase, group A [Atribacteraceae bacterium]
MTDLGKTLIIDGRLIALGNHRNLLELIRSSGIDLPTFCYHSHLSVYGACRLCIVDIAGRGIVASCAVTPEPGMIVRTSTAEIRKIRRLTVELLLANHDVSCPSCPKSATCQLLQLAGRLGVTNIRYRRREERIPLDNSSPAVVRDPNKCILCGDCVRMCSEVQGIGVIDFTHRGSHVQVQPSFGQNLGSVECVDCGQCAAVCPTGALAPKSHIDRAWQAIHDPAKKVVVQIAPAVRVGVGEAFGLPAGQVLIGQLVSALRTMGVDFVYDTAFAADLTVLEEGSEFLRRIRTQQRLPQFTSCCPAWVKFCEQHYPDLLPNISSCRSPQQMFGSLAKRLLVKELGVNREDIFVISIMPCTAKKFEATRPEFALEGSPDIDAVITTQELATMIREAGLNLAALEPDKLDMPFGFKSGAGIIFGASGGVTEAVLRFAGSTLAKHPIEPLELKPVRGVESWREAEIELNGRTLRLAVVSGLGTARQVMEEIQEERVRYDLVEVMACPGGCVGGAGQPPAKNQAVQEERKAGLRRIDTMLQMHSSEENPYLQKLYADTLGKPNSELVHEWLHTNYVTRRRTGGELPLEDAQEPLVRVDVCVGTNCHLRGGHDLLRHLVEAVDERSIGHLVDINATFCHEMCDRGPTVTVNESVLERCTIDMLLGEVDRILADYPQEIPVK